jgi:hypothetical protein
MGNVKPVCPRCGHYIPNDETPGAHVGALSRVDSTTEICSACGRHEAFQQFESGTPTGATPVNQWPVDVPDGARL